MITKKNQLAELTVSEFASNLKFLIEDHFPYVKIRGEISGLKIHNSGHIYFNLKDDNALINAVCFKNRVSSLTIYPKEGQEIIALGKISAYIARSNYQIIIENIEDSVLGSLMEVFLKRKEKLQKEGLFDIEYKKKLPKYPENIAVITSESGAVFHDICHRIKARFPCNISLFSTPVQGADAALMIANALNKLNELEVKPDVIILARGGGSVEDLWAFNEEIVARAIFNSAIPIIAAIGHETDFTIADYVADIRAPTPTAAAEMATPDIIELRLKLDFLAEKILEKLATKIAAYQKIITLLKPIHPYKYIEQKKLELNITIKEIDRLFNKKYLFLKERLLKIQLVKAALLAKSFSCEQQIADYSLKINNAVKIMRQKQGYKLVSLSDKLTLLSYKNTLKRGYVIARNKESDVVKSSASAKIISSLEFYDAIVKVKLDEV
jgi:exodeoxyribonuclease VII large subunit